MSSHKASDRRARWRFVGFAAAAVLVAAAVGAQAGGWADVRDEVESRYRVTALRDGVLLQPVGEADVATVEIGDGDVAIDGEEVRGSGIERALGAADAELMERLASLEGDELKALFGYGDPDDSPVAREAEAALEAEIESAPSEAEDELREELNRREEEIRALEDEIRERARATRRDSGRRSYRSHTDARVVVGNSVHVAEDEHSEEIVAIFGPVTIDGRVSGDVVAVGGSARINGQVDGEVVAVMGGVDLGPNADIRGNVTSIGGGLHREPGARIGGEITEVDVFDGTFGPVEMNWGWWDWPGPFFVHDPISDLVGKSLKIFFLAILGAIALLVARGPMDRMAAVAGAEPWKAAAVGVTSLIFFLPALIIGIILLCISIIGIPLLVLVPFAVLGFALLAFLGYLAVAYRLGQWSEERFGWSFGGPVLALIVGLLWIHGWGIMAEIVDVIDTHRDWAGFLVVMLLFFGFLVKLFAWSVGVGSVILVRFSNPPGATVGVRPPIPPVAPLGAASPATVPTIWDDAGSTGDEEAGASVGDEPWPEEDDDEAWQAFHEEAAALDSDASDEEAEADDSTDSAEPDPDDERS